MPGVTAGRAGWSRRRADSPRGCAARPSPRSSAAPRAGAAKRRADRRGLLDHVVEVSRRAQRDRLRRLDRDAVRSAQRRTGAGRRGTTARGVDRPPAVRSMLEAQARIVSRHGEASDRAVPGREPWCWSATPTSSKAASAHHLGLPISTRTRASKLRRPPISDDRVSADGEQACFGSTKSHRGDRLMKIVVFGLTISLVLGQRPCDPLAGADARRWAASGHRVDLLRTQRALLRRATAI